MTLDPVKMHVMAFEKREELFPEVDIKCRLLIGLYPALFFPAIDPAFSDAVDDILAVGSENYTARLLKCGEGSNDAEQLHAVICSLSRTAGKFFFDISEAQDDAKTTGARITAASAVGKDLHGFDKNHSCICDDTYYNLFHGNNQVLLTERNAAYREQSERGRFKLEFSR